MFKKILLLSLFVYSQTNCWKEIVPKSERFPLMKLPAELIHQIVLSKIQLPEIDIDRDASLSADTKDLHYLSRKLDYILEVSLQFWDARENFINDYLKNLSKTNHFFKVHSNQILNEFDNKIIKHFLLQASKIEHVVLEHVKQNSNLSNKETEETARILSKRLFLSPTLAATIRSCKCPKIHNSEFSKKLIEAGADIRDLIPGSRGNIFR